MISAFLIYFLCISESQPSSKPIYNKLFLRFTWVMESPKKTNFGNIYHVLSSPKKNSLKKIMEDNVDSILNEKTPETATFAELVL